MREKNNLIKIKCKNELSGYFLKMKILKIINQVPNEYINVTVFSAQNFPLPQKTYQSQQILICPTTSDTNSFFEIRNIVYLIRIFTTAGTNRVCDYLHQFEALNT